MLIFVDEIPQNLELSTHMKKILLGVSLYFVLCSSFFTVITAQDLDPILVKKNNQLVSASNLYPNNDACTKRQFTGTVSKVSNTSEWVELTVRTKSGLKSMSLQFSNRADMSFIIPFLKRKGRSINFGTYECGSGAFLYVDSIR